MSRWSPDRSSLLSLLLDEVTGTQEAMEIKQDFAKIYENLTSMPFVTRYYTGSKAEGLNLPGSDDDFMHDINYSYNIKVVQSYNIASDVASKTILHLHTENTKPGFALLKIPRVTPDLWTAIERIDGVQYLSSNLVVQNSFNLYKLFNVGHFYKRQGPSLENQLPKDFGSREGMDQVLSIHCDFWPNDALEWHQRPRQFGWPTPSTISSIISFGFHLVAIGHPHSDTKSTEWRISFSVAERALVWSFNHIQMQCYAVMKIILKEFIKKKCSPQNQVLCSYFIKTFLFWKFETTDAHFWRADNFRECIKYLIINFVHCLHNGIIRHYFIPRFNLLSVKLTRQSQNELLQLYDIVIQYDISILKECKTFQPVWSKFLSVDENQMSIRHNGLKTNFIKSDTLLAQRCNTLFLIVRINTSGTMINHMKRKFGEASFLFHLLFGKHDLYPNSEHLTSEYAIGKIMPLTCKSHLKTLVIKQLLLDKFLRPLVKPSSGNKKLYKLHQMACSESSSLDLSTSKLWYAIMLISKRDFTSALSILNELMSRIPTFHLCVSDYAIHVHNSREAEQSYADKFMNSGITVMERVRKAWMMPLRFEKPMADIVPLAIQVELYFSDRFFIEQASVDISPIVILHYLEFQCYHELGQYDHRRHALRRLLDNVKSDGLTYDYSYYHSLNIVGHCLLVDGDKDKARQMFTSSSRSTERFSKSIILNKDSSAEWYLQHFC